jgi:hypothetical protein
MATAEQIREATEAVRQWPYQNHRAVALLYEQRATQVFSEDFLCRLYFQIKRDGTLDIAFPGLGLKHLNQFVSYLSGPRLGFLICCLKTETKPHPVGWGFLTEIDGPEDARKAAFAFGFFKEVHGRREHIDLSFMMLSYWFRECKVMQLYGTTINPLAKNYSKRFGFRRLCVLPRFFDGKDANLITLSAEEFWPIYDRWKLLSPPPASPTLIQA